jgi:hypothetical protein
MRLVFNLALFVSLVVGCGGTDGGSDPVCGDGRQEGDEVCDGRDLNGQTCETLGHLGGDLACDEDCGGYDLAGCGSELCGNGQLDAGEECDGIALGGKTCFSHAGHSDGELLCLASCQGLDTSGCHTPGNGIIEGPELCDGPDLAGATCLSHTGLADGELVCDAGGLSYDTTGCHECGNQAIEGPEVCDGADIASATCSSEVGLVNGSPACALNCLALDVSDCHTCGNGTIEGPEVCDGADIAGATCLSLAGYDDGLPTCLANCLTIDTANCHTAGNGVIEGPEVCDGANLGGQDCLSVTGQPSGTLACSADGLSFDTSDCNNCTTDSDVLTQTGCGFGYACDVDPASSLIDCRTVGSTPHYDACTVATDCQAGAGCYSMGGTTAHCLPYCDIQGTPSCPGTGVCAATITNHPSLGLCIEQAGECDPVDNTGCTTGEQCFLLAGGASCQAPTANPAAAGDPCDQGSPAGCEEGASCFNTPNPLCFEICNLSDGTGCDTGTCQNLIASPDYGICQ